MRAAVAAAVVAAASILCSCASDRLSVNPPRGIDFSGQWKLNEADSDDPQRLLQAPAANNGNANNGDPGSGRSRQRRTVPGVAPPATPPGGQLAGPLRWPGKSLTVKQVAGTVAFTSEGRNRLCQPGSKKEKKPKVDPHDRDSMPAARDSGPSVCGWSEATLVVQGGDPDEDKPAYEEQYTLSEDHQRLVEVVEFKGGRSNGFTLSRVWDRVAQ